VTYQARAITGAVQAVVAVLDSAGDHEILAARIDQISADAVDAARLVPRPQEPAGLGYRNASSGSTDAARQAGK